MARVSVAQEWEKYWRSALAGMVGLLWQTHRADEGCTAEVSCPVCDAYEQCYQGVRAGL